ncbi:autoinducer binding domain-containing protein [Pseudomonas sp. R11F]|uniref:Transcriptional regulator n=1 Tax=Pseudomonas palleroniana TaxID=191390 RepID=A0A2L1JA70_9PSED|nr:autoinducer binding domain-containing protein [Pseudomonas palleroniana]AVE05380.1 transcriptional regulator [Pseudomonas palleroniana]UOK39908.1 autoinducer binding domain-containing protein [Pseudomonas palleroniana]UOP11854.1 autoinducer binding domain-containing protein [Pseudomonas palleroniana]
MERYLSWIRQLSQHSQTPPTLTRFIESATLFSHTIGFDFFSYAVCETTPFTRPKIHIFGNYPRAWLDRYKEQNYAVIDPTIRHCKVSSEPVLWSTDFFEECPQLWKDARAFELNIGLAQPSFNARGYIALLSLARKDNAIEEAEWETLKPLIKAFSETAGYHIFELEDALTSTLDIEFGQKEKEVLRWTADGKTSEEIGRILNVTADAVNFHLRNIQKKIGACNRVQAVTYAVAQGHI